MSETLETNKPTVLIIDDPIMVRKLPPPSFNKSGYGVKQAYDAQEGWGKIASSLPCNLVFRDIEIPTRELLIILVRYANSQYDDGLLTHHNQVPAKLRAI